jgi:hypothetical protein
MAIDKDETKKSLFGGLKQQEAHEAPKSSTPEVKRLASSGVTKSKAQELPK